MPNILRNLLVKEMSLVDHPANPGAKVLLAKRGLSAALDVEKDMYSVSRFADMLGSLSYLMQSSENEAEVEGDKSPVPAALRTWLKDGTAIFRSMAKEEVDELIASLVAKREFSAAARRSDARSGAAMPDGSFPIKDEEDLRNAMRLAGHAKNPTAARAHIKSRAKALGLTDKLSAAYKGDGNAVSKVLSLFKAIGHATGALSESVKSIVGDKDVADKPKLIDETIKQFSEHVEDELEKTLSGDAPEADEGDDAMSPELRKALGLAETASEADAVAAITKRDADAAKLAADLAIAKAAMSDDEKSFHDGLKTDDDKEKFRAKSREQRAEQMKKRVDLPPEVRKALDESEELKKRLAVLEVERETERFEKRAVEIGLSKAQGELLMKAHKGDAAALKKLEDAIKGLNAQIDTGKLFTEFGTNDTAAADAYGEITAKAEALRKANPKLTIEKAKAAVIEDPSNAELMKRYREEQRQRINKAA